MHPDPQHEQHRTLEHSIQHLYEVTVELEHCEAEHSHSHDELGLHKIHHIQILQQLTEQYDEVVEVVDSQVVERDEQHERTQDEIFGIK